eukprot:scaffold22746_cov56-Phaeocystis_antarctica.AAC.1
MTSLLLAMTSLIPRYYLATPQRRSEVHAWARRSPLAPGLGLGFGVRRSPLAPRSIPRGARTAGLLGSLRVGDRARRADRWVR